MRVCCDTPMSPDHHHEASLACVVSRSWKGDGCGAAGMVLDDGFTKADGNCRSARKLLVT